MQSRRATFGAFATGRATSCCPFTVRCETAAQYPAHDGAENMVRDQVLPSQHLASKWHDELKLIRPRKLNTDFGSKGS